MSDFFSALLQYEFLRNAAMAAFLASVGCGVMGSYVVIKRIGYMAGGIAHSALGGLGVAYFFGLDPIMGALPAAWIAAIIIGLVKLYWNEHEDTLISALWAVGMAVGILFVAKTPGYNADLMSYLFGNVLMVSRGDLLTMLGLDLVVLVMVVLFHKQLLAISFDEEFAALRGIPVAGFYILLLIMVATTVVVLIQVVGLILVLALLVLPAAISRQYTNSLLPMMSVAILLGLIFTLGGLAISYQPDLPAGATMVLLAGIAYLLATVFTDLVRRRKRVSRSTRAPGA